MSPSGHGALGVFRPIAISVAPEHQTELTAIIDLEGGPNRNDGPHEATQGLTAEAAWRTRRTEMARSIPPVNL